MIIPDTKDWTWVLERPCAECGLNAGSVGREEVAGLVRANAASWVALLAGDAAALRERPGPDVWSELEYACHVRDVFRLFAFRLDLMLTQDDPVFPNWDQDETAVAGNYGDQDPARVSVELAEAAEVLAGAFERVDEAAWERVGRRSDGAGFTVESFARYLLHDVVHHVFDVTGSQQA
ncbi:DinB family protein [Streptacidiphilus sp. MAP12-33]|uniref:DinB family protein n=1 Tax=Streptacidiphilus sp. MAP12-33 TaxID=3156266 RepID=UPI003515EDF7